MRKTRIKLLSLVTTFALVAAILAPAMVLTTTVEAVAVTLSASPTEVDATTATDVTLTWTSNDNVESVGTTFTLSIDTTLDAVLDDCGTPDVWADGSGSTGAGTWGSLTATGAVFTTAGGSGATSTAARSLCIQFPSSTTVESVAATMTSSFNDDTGTVLIHMVENNDVSVTANVIDTLSFNIRTLADDGELNTCAFGTVNTSLSNPDGDAADDGGQECGYSLAIGTNAQGGFATTIDSDGAFINGTSDEWNEVGEGESWNTSGGEEDYGLASVLAAQTGRDPNDGDYDVTVDLAANYDADATPIPTSPASFLSYTDGIKYSVGGGATDVTTIVHGLVVGSGTPAGTYTQQMTYATTATF